MKYVLYITARARQDINDLDVVTKRSVGKRLAIMESCSDIFVYAKKLQVPYDGEYRIRAGDYRIIFSIDKSTIFISRVRHRRDAYRR